jgi:TRAP-type mannitol/chloroaromatic compound transport system permease large subunit
VAPPAVKTTEIYAGALPILAIQVAVLTLLWSFPSIATWLPGAVYPGR